MSSRVYVSIITIGDELLIGQVIDTNSAWIAQELNKIGIAVKRRVAIGDVWDDIWDALNEEQKYADIILITGGLGPTVDDITKPLLCKYFEGNMIVDDNTLQHITCLFEKILQRPVTERNRKQAEVPDVCTVLKNEAGTAPGMLFEKNGKLFIAMPGVPFEMQWIMQHHVIGLLQKQFTPGILLHRTLITAGIGESFLADRIQHFEATLPAYIKLAYLPNFGMVRLRLTAQGSDKILLTKELDTVFASLQLLLKDVMVVNEDVTIQEGLGKLLVTRGETIATAESCTGGYIAHLLTSVAGSSAYFMGGVVSYDNSVKNNLLSVPKKILQTVGAVSEEVVVQMAQNVRVMMDTTYAIAVSGIMGPAGGTPDKPVGTVWIAVCNEKNTITKLLHARYDRMKNIQVASANALLMLYQMVNDITKEH